MQKDNVSPSASHQDVVFISGCSSYSLPLFLYNCGCESLDTWRRIPADPVKSNKINKKTLIKLLCLEKQEIYGLECFLISSQVSKLCIQLVQTLRLKINNDLSFSDPRTTGWCEHSLDGKEQCWWWILSSYLTWHSHSETETIQKWHSQHFKN